MLFFVFERVKLYMSKNCNKEFFMATIDITKVPANIQLINKGQKDIWIPLESTASSVLLEAGGTMLVKAETVSGIISYLTQQSDILIVNYGTDVDIVSGKTFDSVPQIEIGKSYTFSNCTFNNGLAFSKAIKDLSLSNCNMKAANTGAGGNKGIYLTTVESINIDGCSFEGPVSAGTLSTDGYGLDLNIYNGHVSSISISNCTFNVTAGDSKKAIAISIKARLGATDHPTDLPGEATPGTVGSVNISNNYFATQCASIYMGTGPKGSDSAANTTTGDFTMTVSNNQTDVSVYERYKYNKSETAPAVVVKANTTQVF